MQKGDIAYFLGRFNRAVFPIAHAIASWFRPHGLAWHHRGGGMRSEESSAGGSPYIDGGGCLEGETNPNNSHFEQLTHINLDHFTSSR